MIFGTPLEGHLHAKKGLIDIINPKLCEIILLDDEIEK
jgi:hypothetical protein